MYFKKIMIIFAMLGAYKAQGQTTKVTDSTEFGHHQASFSFGKEKGGSVCVNGLEKLELACGSDRGMNEVLQLHFYGPWITSGRVFVAAAQDRNENKKSSVHFIDASIDLTVKEFPLHFSYSFGLDKIGHRSNVSYVGPGASFYFSDIPYFHKYFHILRISSSYEKLTQHHETVLRDKDGLSEDSSVVLGHALEFSGFFQIQPFHLTKHASIFSEGLLRMREHENFSEVEIGIRHKKIMQEMMGIGVRGSWDNFHWNSLAFILRFNLSNPNPRRL